MPVNRFWNLFAKKLAGEVLPHEMTELEVLMKENPGLKYQSEYISRLWKNTKDNKSTFDEEVEFEAHVNKLKEAGINFPDIGSPLELEITEKPKIKKKRAFLLLSSFVCILLAAGFIWKISAKMEKLPIQEEKKYSEVSTKSGTKTKLVLPDSSVVWLNAGSKLTYNEHFGVANRNTTLSGEAFFDVKKNSIPFVIHTSKIQIKVLGTAFNVRSYDNEKTTETSLVRGRVEITLDKRPGEKFILKPNEKLIVSNEIKEANEKTETPHTPIIALDALHHHNDNIIETSWIDNKLIFQNESFEDISKRMERWFDVVIEFKDEALKQQRLSGTFTNETVQEALEELQMTTKFHFKIKQGLVIITR